MVLIVLMVIYTCDSTCFGGGGGDTLVRLCAYISAAIKRFHLESFYIMAFCSPMLEHVLYNIYNYIIIKHVACI